jgi:hypothetical protein
VSRDPERIWERRTLGAELAVVNEAAERDPASTIKPHQKQLMNRLKIEATIRKVFAFNRSASFLPTAILTEPQNPAADLPSRRLFLPRY